MSDIDDGELSDDALAWVDDDSFPSIEALRAAKGRTTSPRRSAAIQALHQPLYDNCTVLSMEDGSPLCRISRKRCMWYVNRDLAEIVKDDGPLIIRLKFPAKGGPSQNDLFTLSTKRNCCVRCGVDSDLRRAYIVPHCYRREMPPAMTSHQSHDIVLLCMGCHTLWSMAHARLRKVIAQESSSPVNGVRVGEGPDRAAVKAKKSACSLLRYRDRIPQPRADAMMAMIRAHLGRDDVTDDDLASLAEVDNEVDVDTRELIPHGRIVVQNLNGDFAGFVRRWRQHFVDTLQPRHLPEYWSVDYAL
ncbi:hypothetical protein PBRA_004012 [Plasmodiophora brassicae]|nr:hypothetical protein PBRA_004012 [Plasmodiophora brassicae]